MYMHKKENSTANFQLVRCATSNHEIIEIVQNYTYIRTLISSTGNFLMALDQLKEKAVHALFSLRKDTNISKIPIPCK